VPAQKKRCAWAGEDPLYVAYHDDEWGVPVHADRDLFEFITLEGAQAGLSWITILRKREGYRKAFAEFEIEKVARLTKRRVERLMGDASIVRNRAKIESTIGNAKAALKVIDEFGSLDAYLWQFVDGKPIQNRRRRMSQIPAKTKVADVMSKDLKKRGFRFVGPTICYAFMQAAGLVNDHLVDCHRYKAVSRLR
jgi:DNA-3-methyladenine glycosylase I